LDILQRVLSIVERAANRPFLIDAISDRTFTYADTYRLGTGLAVELQARGIRRGDRVAIILHNSGEFALLYFACLYAGAVAVPVNPELHQREIDYVLAHSGAKLLVYSSATSGFFDGPALARNGIRLWKLIPCDEPRRADGDDADTWSLSTIRSPQTDGWRPFGGASADDLFSITFTSGTTSLPKGVSHRIGSLLENAAAFNYELEFDSTCRFLHILQMGYMAGFLNTLLCPFMAEATVVLASPFGPKSMLNFWEPVIRYGADTLWLSPTMLAGLLRMDRDPAGREYSQKHLKTVCVGTAPLPLKTKKEFQAKYGIEVFESYGLSELLLVSGNSRRFPRLDNSVGRVLPLVDAQVVDEGGKLADSGQEGEILIKTPYVMAGYLNYQTLQPDSTTPGSWFSTGDVGYLNKEGDLFVTARKKDLIIRGGVNVSPRLVEDVLLEHDAVAQVAVIGLPHDFYGEEVVAAIDLKPGCLLASERGSLIAFCKERLSPHCVPTRFVEVEQFPVSSNGKVQKNRLKEQLLATPKS